MKMINIEELHKLPVKDKIEIVQTLWDDIAKESIQGLPETHKKILDERLKRINAGKASFKSWEEIQKKYK